MKHPGMINKVSNISDEIFNWSEENFKKNDQYDLGRINPNNTQIFVHVDIEQYPKFKTHIALQIFQRI